MNQSDAQPARGHQENLSRFIKVPGATQAPGSRRRKGLSNFSRGLLTGVGAGAALFALLQIT